ncbi:TPA: hypothetical protein CPT90_07775 [Candidatus Gastranaerophilales bacterium HUM_3]|jgi:hypothetical protein|nr:hypothetical protein [Acinetobacter sp.]CCZ50601.1 unknown [Acinetobacter sp. CAG:196]DAA82926.1 MAG TPA: hypothetical protein CPT90_07775 [Candidatus Gastranaerophilales bacterium HUM_3]DAA94734.1 MAG TPA: hypothetical protein CPT88_07830 [Candidatus Gastranaerophilales bacterium HUM_8]DAA99521.1 MAG TPA: hypothetical protein CPT89_09800 [Candidatus Gastranaerophilales bacterium HUM_11]DAB07956.1 MAG TPA: hypothetical protein CPT92_04270 [Candidatus Gastranaerophilales bacterium HUM_13]DA
MNLLLLKQLSILSAFAGAILGFITIIPYVSFISFMLLILCLSAFVLAYLKQNELIGIISVREGCIFGAVIGFVSFLAFAVVFTPISMLLGWLIPSYTQGFMRFFLGSFGSFIVMIFLIIFMGGISALFNAFSGLVTAYVYELITGVKKENNQNSSVDFEIR